MNPAECPALEIMNRLSSARILLIDDTPEKKDVVAESLRGQPWDVVEALNGPLGLDLAKEKQFDLILLGIGADGHCASLFPNQASLNERSRLVVGVPEAGLAPFVPRISFTLPMLAAGRHVVFLATGEAKADAIAKAFGPGTDPDPATPASLLVPEAKLITVLCDQSAAAHVPTGDRR